MVTHRSAITMRWQQKMKEQGRCRCCGRPRRKYAQHCDRCRKKANALERQRNAAKQQEPQTC